jgi:hypothetical protein
MFNLQSEIYNLKFFRDLKDFPAALNSKVSGLLPAMRR